jgi:hypothetical protein
LTRVRWTADWVLRFDRDGDRDELGGGLVIPRITPRIMPGIILWVRLPKYCIIQVYGLEARNFTRPVDQLVLCVSVVIHCQLLGMHVKDETKQKDAMHYLLLSLINEDTS